jgi:hypothetical protein
MANKKISELTTYTTPISTDQLPIVDDAGVETKKIAYSDLKANINTGTEPSITGTTASDFFSGAKTFLNFAATVRAVVLTGLSLATNAAITATDSILVALGKLQAQITANIAAISGKENTITGTTSADFWSGAKTFINFASTVLATVLTGLSTATNAAITATDSILIAFGKLQAQINVRVIHFSGTTANRSIAFPSPTIGNFYSNTTTGRLEWYDGSSWRSIPFSQILLTEIQNIANNTFLGNLTGSSTTPQQVNGLDIWDSAQQAFRYNIGGINEWLSACIFNQVNFVTVANTTTETNLIGTGQTGSTSIIPANFLVAGKSLKPKMRGFIATNATAPTIRIQAKLNSTVILDSGVVAMNAITGSQLFEIDFDMTCRTTGVSGTVIEQGVFRYFRDSTSEERIGLVSTAAVTINTTIAQTLTITITWGTANASNTITSANFKLLKEG